MAPWSFVSPTESVLARLRSAPASTCVAVAPRPWAGQSAACVTKNGGEQHGLSNHGPCYNLLSHTGDSGSGASARTPHGHADERTRPGLGPIAPWRPSPEVAMAAESKTPENDAQPWRQGRKHASGRRPSTADGGMPKREVVQMFAAAATGGGPQQTQQE